MISKDLLRDRILEECDFCLHLFTKIPEGGMDYRPTPGQRSTLELLRYLSIAAAGGAHYCVDGNWDVYQELVKEAEDMQPEDFPAAMERNKERVKAVLDGVSQEQLDTQKTSNPMGQEMTVGEALLTMPHNWMVAYRMQLFLYAKQAGNEDIWTPNCWVGMDWEKPTPEDVPDPEEVGSA